MTQVSGHWVDRPESQAVCAMLTEAGHQALFVGGCVRNDLLGVEVSDIDISTDAVPERVINLAERAGLNPVPTGIDHGTITVVSGHVPHEVTTFRRDVETFGRHAVVAYTTDVREDALRRDFSMNALYARRDGTVIDPLNGLPDLRARRVRFIEDASARIQEDYLRILRFFRFHAWYGDPQAGLDPDGLAACAALSAGLETLSKERVGAEFMKLLSAPDPAPALSSMAQAGCLARIVQGAEPRQLPVLVDLEATAGIVPDPVRRLATIGGQDLKEALKLSKAQDRQRVRLAEEAGSTAGPAELAYRHGIDDGRNIMLVRSALLETPVPTGLEHDLERGANAEFPLSAADLMPALQGAPLGEKLKELEDRWIASDFTLARDALLS